MPISYEDATPIDISGDPAPQRPLNPKQMQGAQKAKVNQMRTPTNGHQLPESKSGQTEQQIQSEDKPGGAGPGVTPDTPVLGGLEKLGGALIKGEQASQITADHALGFNPAIGHDWWQNQLENPTAAYFLGRHIYDAYFGAFLNPDAIARSVHEVWNQDNAVSWLLHHPSGFNSITEQ